MINYEYLMSELEKYFGKYQISFQFWGEANNNCYIMKDDVDLWDAGGEDSPIEIMVLALDYLNRINGNAK